MSRRRSKQTPLNPARRKKKTSKNTASSRGKINAHGVELPTSINGKRCTSGDKKIIAVTPKDGSVEETGNSGENSVKGGVQLDRHEKKRRVVFGDGKSYDMPQFIYSTRGAFKVI